MNEKNKVGKYCKEKWNRHKKKVKIVVGVGTAFAIGYVVAKNWDKVYGMLIDAANMNDVKTLVCETMETPIDNVDEAASEVFKSVKEVYVKAHPMKLPDGKCASETAKELAKKYNVVLPENQTMRREHVRYMAA